ncbi:hypothetical protein B0T26DRAFT_675613 [Lasiosphaeria miniovina]|uniref:Uncharacterized protein n=1 Tax=Lasiosphaeria miniovina TaxID=1954250 RepID=A0AA40AK30_9PEZI|nr:uncharacterized protein B0T26DRAFT_675613 [Lasiosphaeria miniovina]KAK0717283.1 hypothetical protein B0T26DRAFT_675613 [Lasiosphaeria miniovina]
MPPRTLSSREPRRRAVLLTFIVTSVFWWLFFSFQSDVIPVPSTTITNTPETGTKTLHCGNSTAEARALGCTFDVLAFMWVPAPCFDRETTEAYQKAVNWHGYNDPDGREVLDLETMSERTAPGKYYTSAREHAVHCAFAWQKQHRGYLRGGGGLYIDDNSAGYHHTRHCSEVLMKTADRDPKTLDEFETKTTVKFSKCLVEA